MGSLQWIRSQFCESNACVEVLFSPENMVSVRNSTDPQTVIKFTHEEWQAFITDASRGLFNLDSA